MEEEEEEEEEICEELSVPANVSELVLGGRTANTQYGVSLLVRYHDNSTQTISRHCVTTKVGGSVRLELQPIVVSNEMLKFQLNFSLIGQIPVREKVEVLCQCFSKYRSI